MVSSTVTLPLWLVVLIGVLSALAALDHLLLPSARWVMRRRLNRAIDELNSRLKLRIQPFKLAKRQSLIDQLVFDPEVLGEIERYAESNGVTRAAAQEMARHYAREIVPSFSAYAYFGIGARLARWLSTLLYRVRLGYMDEDALKTVDPDSSVIFVINHRSNMDYVLVTYMASTSSALSYAVGEWARVWLLQSLIRSMGAYFVRRDSREPLYRKVLARYVHMAVAGGLAQAVFPEGGLTRDGKLQAPKLGLIGYMVSGFDAKGPRDAVFVPVGINYDRVLEDRLQLGAHAAKEGGRARHRFNLVVLLKAHIRPYRAASARALVSFRLCLRELRCAAVVAAIRQGARHRLPRARSGRAFRRGRTSRRCADGESGSGGAGAAGGAWWRPPCSMPASRSRCWSSSRACSSSRNGSPQPAPMCIFRAATRSMPSK